MRSSHTDGWNLEPAGENRFSITVPQSATSGTVSARAAYAVAGVEAIIEREALTSFVDGTGVQRRRALAVGPAISVSFGSEAGALPIGRGDYSLSATLRNNASRPVRGNVRLELPEGWKGEPTSAPFSFEKEGEEREVKFEVIPRSGAAAGSYPVEAVAEYEGLNRGPVSIASPIRDWPPSISRGPPSTRYE